MEGEDLQESDMEILMEDEAEIDEDYAAKLINNVIDGVSDDDSSMPPGRRRGKKGKKKPLFRPRK